MLSIPFLGGWHGGKTRTYVNIFKNSGKIRQDIHIFPFTLLVSKMCQEKFSRFSSQPIEKCVRICYAIPSTF